MHVSFFFTKSAQQSDEKGNAINTIVKHQGYKCVLGFKLNVNRNFVYKKTPQGSFNSSTT